MSNTEAVATKTTEGATALANQIEDRVCKAANHPPCSGQRCNCTASCEDKCTAVPSDPLLKVVRDAVCKACDPNSNIPHEIQVTRLRVANLCCAGEEKIIRSTLNGLPGIEQIAVNVIGRYAVIKHCAVACCCPVSQLVDLLNAKHLGVTVQELTVTGKEEAEEGVDKLHVVYLTVVWILFLIGVGLNSTHPLGSEISYLISTGLGLLTVLYAAYVAIVTRQTIDISVLMTIAISGAIAAREYFDASLVVALYLSAEQLEALIMLRVRAAIRSSSTEMSKEAFLVSGTKVSVDALKVGDVIAVRAGEMILGDGVVVKGEGVVDESPLTGESIPITKKKQSVVLSGTVVQNGYLEVELTSNTAENTLSRLKQTIEDVQADKGSYARLADRFAIYWTPGVLLVVLCLIVVGGAVSEDWYVFVNRGLILLVLACPCAILIAAPVPCVCAIAAAAQQGVLIKGSLVLERLSSVDTVALDKTGTLTKGFFKVAECLNLGGEMSDVALKLAAALEAKSTHPLANAVVQEFTGCLADVDLVPLPAVRKVQVVDGVGVTGWVQTAEDDWSFVAVGNEKMLEENGGKVSAQPEQKKLMKEFYERSAGKVVLLVAIDEEAHLLLSLSDEIRSESASFVKELQGSMGMTVSMITGDHKDVALAVSQVVGIPESECHSRLLPTDKLAWVQNKQAAGARVLMVGDGINDSTALAAASVGVAMGAGGSAMAVTSADVVLMTDNLQLLPPAIRLCRQASRAVLEGFVFAIGVKIVAIVLAILGYLTFWQAIVIDIGSLVVVVINGTKLLWNPVFDLTQTVKAYAPLPQGKAAATDGLEMV